MALTPFNEDIEIISKLSDLPNDTEGISPAELKERFDRAGKLLKEYINGVLLTELGGASAAANLGVGAVNGTDMGATIQAVLDALAAQIVEATLGTIPDKSIGESKFADLAVSTRALSELAVTAAKIAAGAVTAEKLATGAVSSAKIATGAVGTAKIATGAVTNEKTDFSAGFSPAGPIRLTKGVHYFDREEDLPAVTDQGRLYLVKVE